MKIPANTFGFFRNPSVLLLRSHSASDNRYYPVVFIEWYGPFLPRTKIPMEGGQSCMNPSQNAGSLSLTPEFILLPSCTHPEFWNSQMIFTNLVRLKWFYFLSTIPSFLHHLLNGLPHIYGQYTFFLLLKSHICQYFKGFLFFHLSKYNWFNVTSAWIYTKVPYCGYGKLHSNSYLS